MADTNQRIGTIQLSRTLDFGTLRALVEDLEQAGYDTTLKAGSGEIKVRK